MKYFNGCLSIKIYNTFSNINPNAKGFRWINLETYMKIRVVFVTCGLFLLSLFVSLIYKDSSSVFLGMPFALCFNISTSFILFFYFCFETWIFLRSEN